MPDTLRRGLDSALDMDLPVDPDNLNEVRGFDGELYYLGVEASGTLVVASTSRSPEELKLSYSQLAIARYALEHIGEPFRSSEVTYGGVTPTKDQFNSAMLDRNDGLLPFFAKAAGGNNSLWYRDRNIHQLGEGSESQEAESDEGTEEESAPWQNLLSTDQNLVIESVRELVPLDGIEKNLLLSLLAERFPELMPTQLEGLLRASIHRIRNNFSSDSFAFEQKGRGSQRQDLIMMNPALSTASSSGILEKPTISIRRTPRDLGGAGATVVSDKPPRTRKRSKSGKGKPKEKVLSGDAINRQTIIGYDPIKSREEDRPISWELKPDHIRINGGEALVQVHPDVVFLVDYFNDPHKRWVWLSEVAVKIHQGFMEEAMFKRFVVWANLVVDEVNSLVPAVVINNHGRDTRRDKKTLYRTNYEQRWAELGKFVQGTSLRPGSKD